MFTLIDNEKSISALISRFRSPVMSFIEGEDGFHYAVL